MGKPRRSEKLSGHSDSVYQLSESCVAWTFPDRCGWVQKNIYLVLKFPSVRSKAVLVSFAIPSSVF